MSIASYLFDNFDAMFNKLYYFWRALLFTVLKNMDMLICILLSLVTVITAAAYAMSIAQGKSCQPCIIKTA